MILLLRALCSRRSNCILFALALYLRRARRGREGYLLWRRSRRGPFPHVLYAEHRRGGGLRIVSFKPADPRVKRAPPPLFRGAARWGDFGDTEPIQ